MTQAREPRDGRAAECVSLRQECVQCELASPETQTRTVLTRLPRRAADIVEASKIPSLLNLGILNEQASTFGRNPPQFEARAVQPLLSRGRRGNWGMGFESAVACSEVGPGQRATWDFAVVFRPRGDRSNGECRAY